MVLARMSLLEPAVERPCTVYLYATRHSKGFFSKHGFGWYGTGSDQYGNESETLYFPLTPTIIESIRQALKRTGVSYDATLRIPTTETQSTEPPRAWLFEDPSDSRPQFITTCLFLVH